MRTILSATLIVVVLLAAVLLFAADAAKGKQVYMARCATCHDRDGKGKEAIGRMFKVTMKPLGSKEVQAAKDQRLQEVILKGTGKMPPVAIAPQEAADVVAFLRTLAAK
jgi:mono/diheme cytochrome c family protein